MEFSESSWRGEGTRSPAHRLIISLFITSESPLAQGRLPVGKREVEGGWVVRLDPVSLAALLTSVGEPCSVLQAEQEIPAMANSHHQTEEDGENIPGDSL